MYFPYLYGRQYELLALRDVATDLAGWNNITPVIEPVMAKPGDLGRCLRRLQEVRSPMYLIVNPSQGEFETGVPDTWRQPISEFVADTSLVYPTHQVISEADAATLSEFLERFQGRRVGVVLRQPHISAQDLAAEVDDRDVIVFVHASANPRTYLRELPAGKCVEVAASFNEQARNADYGAPEWFTSSHLEFANDGRPGFSDFGPLPRTFSFGGGRPGAVAIHLSYSDGDGSLWIHHFVSDTTDRDLGDAASKIAEAVRKLEAEVESNPEKFVETAGLQAYLANQVLGLPSNKRQQLIHHLATVAASLGDIERPATNLD
ncbi:sce7725 family protein [Mycolicibacterium wolinskyi]|nr:MULTISPECIES: sce7725 family protein [Mycolicibacterium]MCV7287491.1 sce7725 family protein [Mycolicibacterium wolinskyi]MCV7294389.1 sce7725 family protein [Mycolicibacterium goodii]